MILFQVTTPSACERLHCATTRTSAGYVQPLTLTQAATIAARIEGAGISDQHTANAQQALAAMVAGTWRSRPTSAATMYALTYPAPRARLN